MGSVKVTVFGRIKPFDKPCQEYKLIYGEQEEQIIFNGNKTSGKKSFRFKKIFDENATQKEVFETVAKPMINNIFLGYNGTIFTYGQTGSGKTYTMTGDLGNYLYTGLIPRTIHEIFKMKKPDTIITITFCEIYNEHIYDLIRVDRVESDLAQVSLLEVNSGVTHLRNLSVHRVTRSEEAMQLFLRGDANKMVAETNSNARSSRSHVIFSIGLEFPHPTQENLCLKPILYLVDLAGSEKLSKCKAPLSNPYETRYINLSLHYLEQVLIALRQPGRIHVPYRNSLMTALLRNSLGGNCITAMIATFSMAINDQDETLQTCRFAERIALIKNEVKLTESSDPEKEILFLKKENEKLREQIRLMSSDQVIENLSDKEKEKCAKMVYRFIKDNDILDLPLHNIRKVEYCFQIMRQRILESRASEDNKLEKGAYDKRESFQEFFQLYKSSNSQLLNLTQESKVIITKNNTRKKKIPIDIPKVNITYQRYDSLAQLSNSENDNENDISDEKSATELHRLNFSLENIPAKNPEKLYKHNSLMETSTRGKMHIPVNFLREKDIKIPEKDDTESKLSDFYLNLSGEIDTESNNLIEFSTSSSTREFLSGSYFGVKDDSNSNIPFPNVSDTEQKSSDLELCDNPKTLVITEEETTVEKADSENNFSNKILDQISLKTNDSSEFSAKYVPLTGDKEVDEEIVKFYKSRYQLFKNK